MIWVCDMLTSCSSILRLGAEGVKIQISLNNCGEAIDLTTATTTDLHIIKPDDTVVVWSASPIGDATDGVLEYTTITGDLDQLGYYYGEVYLVNSTYNGNSARFEFKVVDDINP